MQLFSFKRPGSKVSMPADSLRDAITLLPYDWKHGPNAGFTVIISPIQDETEYLRARCGFLEHQLQQLLRNRPYV